MFVVVESKVVRSVKSCACVLGLDMTGEADALVNKSVSCDGEAMDALVNGGMATDIWLDDWSPEGENKRLDESERQVNKLRTFRR